MEQKEQRQLQAELEKRGARHVKIGLFDVDGVLRAKYISMEKFRSAADNGAGFCDVIFGWDSSDLLYDNVRVTGWHTGFPDAPVSLDLSTFRMIPWEPDTAFFLLDTGLPVAPRTLLKHLTAKLAPWASSRFSRPNTSLLFPREPPEYSR